MDWFKGKSAGNLLQIVGKNHGFQLRFPFNQSIEIEKFQISFLRPPQPSAARSSPSEAWQDPPGREASGRGWSVALELDSLWV